MQKIQPFDVLGALKEDRDRRQEGAQCLDDGQEGAPTE
jgi:hypothetical protein